MEKRNSKEYIDIPKVPEYITDNLKYSLYEWQKLALENFLINETYSGSSVSLYFTSCLTVPVCVNGISNCEPYLLMYSFIPLYTTIQSCSQYSNSFSVSCVNGVLITS